MVANIFRAASISITQHFSGAVKVASRLGARRGNPLGRKARSKVGCADQTSEYKRKRIQRKFSELDFPIEDLVRGRVRMVQLTVQNSNAAEPGEWLRGADIVSKVSRVFKYVYGAPLGLFWVEEFTQGSKPHVHMCIFVPDVSVHTPVWRGKEYDDVAEFCRDVGLSVIESAQPIMRKARWSISYAKLVRRTNVGGYVRSIIKTITYFAKTGSFEKGARSKTQYALDVDKRYDDSRKMSGYLRLKRFVAQAVDIVSEHVFSHASRLLGFVGWALPVGGVPVRKWAGSLENLAAGGLLSKRLAQELELFARTGVLDDKSTPELFAISGEYQEALAKNRHF